MTFQANTYSGVTEGDPGAEGRIAVSVKVNVKTWHNLVNILFYYSFSLQ